MMKIFLICSFFITQPVLSIACGNEYGLVPTPIPIYKGKLMLDNLLFHQENGYLPYWYQQHSDYVYERRRSLMKKIKPSSRIGQELSWPDIEAALNKNFDYKVLSDYAWYELRVGKKEQAVRLLEALYDKHPDEYNIVANLGTAYEVTGKNDMALSLIRKAVALDPGSHHGSEWIHVRILEQKLSPTPDYRQILRLNTEKDFAQWLSGENYDKHITPDSLMIQIAYQLHERISFIPDPDPIVGQLVFDFADLVALSSSIAKAKPFYKYAITYETSFAEKERNRILIAEGKMAQESSEGTTEEDVSITAGSAKKPVSATSQWIIIAIVAVAVGGIAIFFISRRKRINA